MRIEGTARNGAGAVATGGRRAAGREAARGGRLL
jgi:hypothetical protein